MDLAIAPLGTAAVMITFALVLYGTVTGVIGAIKRDNRLQTSARLSTVAAFIVATLTIVLMETALLTDDFSVSYVAQQSRIASPTWVKVVTLWAALEGSILLWAWLLSAYTFVLAMVAPLTALRPWALAIMQFVQVFFFGVTAFLANPFKAMSVVPLDGPGPNELLQNHWMMAVHPVLMYLGFVGLTVPFAFAMAALITRRPGTEWMTQTRTWTLTGWGFLTAAIIAGGWWSYEVLGWGGYWAWDPVENVSLMPWLTATAFIHSVQVQERRRIMKTWNLLLIVLTFTLSILGTFLTRSGVVSSVHAFGSGPVGPAFLGFFIVVMLGSLLLLAWRWDEVKDTGEIDDVVSREGSFLGVNLVFLAITFAVLLGTLFPLVVEAVTGEKVTVGPPFFDAVSLPLWLIMLALMGIGPLLPWRKAETQKLKHNVLWLVVAFVVFAGGSWLLGVKRIYPMLTVGLAGYNLMSLYLLISGALAPRLRAGTSKPLRVFSRYAYENKRRFGSMIVHFGVTVIAVGIAFSGGYRVDQQIRIPFGNTAEFREYTLHAVDRYMVQTPGVISAGAEVDVYRGGKLISTLKPRVNVFGEGGRPVPTPGVYYGVWHDLYLNLGNTIGPDTEFVVLRVVMSPLVAWIWVGGFIMAFGTIYALSPNRREVKQTAGAETVATTA